MIIESLTVLYHDPEKEGLIEMEAEEQPEETDAVLLVEGLNLPVNIGEGILEESSNVLEGSPLLGHIARLSSGLNKLMEITISLLCKSSIICQIDIYYCTFRSYRLSH